jgi:hypothetical protein
MPHQMKNKNVKKRLIKFWKPELSLALLLVTELLNEIIKFCNKEEKKKSLTIFGIFHFRKKIFWQVPTVPIRS